MKVIDKLSTYAALIGVVSAIGGGFYAWGEFNNRISVLEKRSLLLIKRLTLNLLMNEYLNWKLMYWIEFLM